jgi:hypothetical protein
MPVIGYPIIQLLWFLFVYFRHGLEAQGKVLSIESNFFLKENARQDIKDKIE